MEKTALLVIDAQHLASLNGSLATVTTSPTLTGAAPAR